MVHLLNPGKATLLQGILSKLQLASLGINMVMLCSNRITIFTIYLGVKTLSVQIPCILIQSIILRFNKKLKKMHFPGALTLGK